MKRTKALESTAYHEAGHAFAAWRLGVRTTALSIVPDGDAKGFHAHRTYFRSLDLVFLPHAYDSSPRAQRRVENMALVCCAGPAAQRHFNPRGFRTYHAEDDWHQAVDLLLRKSENTEIVEAYFKLIELRAQNFVAGRWQWPLIECLAEALLKRQRLTGKEVRRVIGECRLPSSVSLAQKYAARMGGKVST